mgnify:CR=1 FL=1
MSKKPASNPFDNHGEKAKDVLTPSLEVITNADMKINKRSQLNCSIKTENFDFLQDYAYEHKKLTGQKICVYQIVDKAIAQFKKQYEASKA